MKKWLRRTLIAALLVGLTFAALYEAATHVGRGWLAGEAFYEGRPTSYWRGKIDDWMTRFDTAGAAELSIDWIQIGSRSPDGQTVRPHRSGNRSRTGWGWPQIPSSPPFPKPRPQNWVTEFLDTFRWGNDAPSDHLPPKVLWGWHGAETVLPELVAEAKHRPFVERALKNVELIRTIQAEGDEPTLSFDPPMIIIY